MEPDSQGYVHTYYGTWNINDKKPKYGVAYFMMDEYIKNSIEKQKDLFKAEISKMFADFSKLTKERLDKNVKEMKAIHDSIGEVSKFMLKIIDVNKFETPAIEKKKKEKVKSKPKKKEDNDDGYL